MEEPGNWTIPMVEVEPRNWTEPSRAWVGANSSVSRSKCNKDNNDHEKKKLIHTQEIYTYV